MISPLGPTGASCLIPPAKTASNSCCHDDKRCLFHVTVLLFSADSFTLIWRYHNTDSDSFQSDKESGCTLLRNRRNFCQKAVASFASPKRTTGLFQIIFYTTVSLHFSSRSDRFQDLKYFLRSDHRYGPVHLRTACGSPPSPQIASPSAPHGLTAR